LSFNMKETLQMVLDYQNKKMSIDEICDQYGVNRRTFYKRRKELIDFTLNFLKQHYENHGEKYYRLLKENKLLQHKVRQLEKEKVLLETKYNWIYYHLQSEQRDSDLLAQLKPGP